VPREEKGLRFVRVGVDAEPVRLEAGRDISTLDLRPGPGGWWLAYAREPEADRDLAMAMVQWIPDSGPHGKAVPAFSSSEAEDVEELRFLAGEGPARLAAVTINETLAVVELGAPTGDTPGRVVARVR
jgi:hypothetical protein